MQYFSKMFEKVIEDYLKRQQKLKQQQNETIVGDINRVETVSDHITQIDLKDNIETL